MISVLEKVENVTSISSFSHIDFNGLLSQDRYKSGLCGKELKGLLLLPQNHNFQEP